MRDVLDTLVGWQRSDGPFVLASVVATSASAPREVGATLAMHPDGRLVGSVSGGCVESAVVESAEAVLRTGVARSHRFGVSDDEAVAVGLTCGGTIEVLVRRVTPDTLDLTELASHLAAETPVALATVMTQPEPGLSIGRSLVITMDSRTGTTEDAVLDRAVTNEARGLLEQGVSGVRHLGRRGERAGDDVAVFVQSFAPRPRLLLFGAIDHVDAVATLGRFLGFHVTVCDPRARFATTDRFPGAHAVVVDWPHRFLEATAIDRRTAICLLTHDPRFDVPALKVALRSDAAYVGAMGSRRTDAQRRQRLRDEGLDDAELARLHGPIGLDLGGITPAETAVSIGAELISVLRGGSGQHLHATVGPIHRSTVVDR